MKKIFLQIYEVLSQLTQLVEHFHGDRPQVAIKNSMPDLKKTIEALPDDSHPLPSFLLAAVEKDYLEPTADPDKFNVDTGTDDSKRED